MPARCQPSTSASRAALSSYIDNLFYNTAADTRFESALFDQIHRSAEKFGEVPFKPEETKDPRHLGELDQNVHVASLVLLAALPVPVYIVAVTLPDLRREGGALAVDGGFTIN